jgi:hypothetical protein
MGWRASAPGSTTIASMLLARKRPGDVLDALVGGANDRVGRCIHRHAGIDPFESDRRSFAVIERLGYETRLALRTI